MRRIKNLDGKKLCNVCVINEMVALSFRVSQCFKFKLVHGLSSVQTNILPSVFLLLSKLAPSVVL